MVFLVDCNGKLVGKYTVRPMNAMGLFFWRLHKATDAAYILVI